MQRSSKVFKAGARRSKLAALQTDRALQSIQQQIPFLRFERVGVDTPGDRDRALDLRASPPDFFTRDLDEQVLSGALDCAIHSAKDLPSQLAPGLDVVWLPWAEDSRDALILPLGRTVSDLSQNPRLGVSSERREAYARRRWSGVQLLPLRGNIEERLRLLDEGQFDVLIMAGAALVRLGLEARITEWLPADALSTPPGQGRLAMTFREGDAVFLRLRALYVQAVRFVGAGIGRASTLTLEGQTALREAEVCLHDELLPQDVLEFLPKDAECINVGKRVGYHSHIQTEISECIAQYAKQGRRVVRLKGGDPTLFGRLAEEIETLERYHLPYRVLPGVNSLSVTAAETGILLTRRGMSRGVTVMTPRQEGGSLASVGQAIRKDLPLVFFMAVKCIKDVSDELIREGHSPATPAAMIFDSGSDAACAVRGTLSDIAAAIESRPFSSSPGLLIIGEAARFSFETGHGALTGARVFLTCSEAIQPKAVRLVTDFGGTPIARPMFQTVPDPAARYAVTCLADYDWVILTSPSSVRCLMEFMKELDVCVRELPLIAVTGAGTAAELKRFGLVADAVPETDFSAEGLLAKMQERLQASGRRVLRFRSEKAGSDLAAELQEVGYEVTESVLYQNVPLTLGEVPAFDAVFFASASAVEQFGLQVGAAALKDKSVVVIGKPTADALRLLGIDNPIIPREATVDGAISALAAFYVSRALELLS